MLDVAAADGGEQRRCYFDVALVVVVVAAVARVDVGAELEQQLDLLFTRPLDTLAGDEGVRLLALLMERIAKRHAALDEERNDHAR